MRTLAFEKWQGTGNDFLVVDEPAEALSKDEVARLCDRHFGVGGDGVLLVGAPVSAGAIARMIVLNADGSRPEMCGNGVRCVALYVAKKRGMGGGSVLLDTDAGPRGCVVDVERGEVSVDMGVAKALGALELDVLGARVRVERISMGNPHAVTFEPLDAAAFQRLGRPVAENAAFPEGTNFEIATPKDDGSIDVLVWERGVGPTLACGTGACAVAAQACIDGRRPFGEEIAVRLPGGPLGVRVERDLRVTMRGPAKRVFRGEVTL